MTPHTYETANSIDIQTHVYETAGTAAPHIYEKSNAIDTSPHVYGTAKVRRPASHVYENFN